MSNEVINQEVKETKKSKSKKSEADKKVEALAAQMAQMQETMMAFMKSQQVAQAPSENKVEAKATTSVNVVTTTAEMVNFSTREGAINGILDPRQSYKRFNAMGNLYAFCAFMVEQAKNNNGVYGLDPFPIDIDIPFGDTTVRHSIGKVGIICKRSTSRFNKGGYEIEIRFMDFMEVNSQNGNVKTIRLKTAIDNETGNVIFKDAEPIIRMVDVRKAGEGWQMVARNYTNNKQE